MREQVVPGDVIRLNGGDLVPADARVFQARDLHLEQAALRGESLPVEKRPCTGTEIRKDSTEDDIVFLGLADLIGIARALQTACCKRSIRDRVQLRSGKDQQGDCS